MTPLDCIVDAIMQQMPYHAEKTIAENSGSGARLRIDWRLDNDAEMPNKRSKAIIIHIPEEFLEDFPNHPPRDQQIALEKTKRFVAQKLEEFQPDHQRTVYDTQPSEEWIIPTNLIFG